MIEYIPQALSSLSATLNIGKALVIARDVTERQELISQFNSAIIDTQAKLMAAQSEQAALSTKINELEQECMRLKDWKAEREKYSRKEIAPGVFAYIANGFVGEFQNAHKYCCNCFDSYKKSTLQQFHIKAVKMGRQKGLSCHNNCPDLIFYNYTQQKGGEDAK